MMLILAAGVFYSIHGDLITEVYGFRADTQACLSNIKGILLYTLS